MTKKQLLALLPKRKQLEGQYKKLTKQEDAIHKKAVRTWLLIETLRGVEIIEGEPCRVNNWSETSFDYTHATADRWADVYLNQHNKVTWGVHLHGPNFGTLREKWLGSDYTKEAAERLAKDWALHGKIGGEK